MVKVVWTETAISDLKAIGEYIAKDSARYAERVVSELFEAVDILENYPNIGVIVPEFNNELIRQLTRGSYRILHLIVNEARIDILTVHDCARLVSNHCCPVKI